jgi:hypothetical protein
VEGALASLYWQGQTLAVATVENGVANLTFPALDNVGDLMVTVSQFNYIPYQGTIAVTPSGGAFVVNQNVTLDDTAGNNDGKADFGETVSLNVKLGNVGVEIANATSATLISADDNIVLLDNSEIFGDIDPDNFVEKPAAFTFKVNDDVADGQTVNFTLHIEYNDTESFDTPISVKLNAPKLTVSNFKIDDTQGGDGDGYLESGETATITIENQNVGHSDSPTALGILTTDSPWLTLSGEVPLGQIVASNGSEIATFQISVAPDAPQVVPANFNYQVAAGNYGAEANFGALVINPILETFETHDFTAFPWVMAGNKPWQISTVSPYSGTYCTRSGTITHNQKSVMELTLNVSVAGNISFARRANCEAEFDFLRFSIDGVEMERWSGNLPWAEVSFPVSAGFHTFSWSYEKDGFVSEGQDRVWVDEISLPPHEIIVGTGNPEKEVFNVIISPNPTSGLTSLWLEMPKEQFVSIEIFDCTGRLARAWQSETRLPAGGHSQPLDMSDLTPGMYFVQVRTEAGTRVEKVVKQ